MSWPMGEGKEPCATFYVLNARDMVVGEFKNRAEAEARAAELLERGNYGCHVIPPRGGYPANLTAADLENRDAGPDDEEGTE